MKTIPLVLAVLAVTRVDGLCPTSILTEIQGIWDKNPPANLTEQLGEEIVWLTQPTLFWNDTLEALCYSTYVSQNESVLIDRIYTNNISTPLKRYYEYSEDQNGVVTLTDKGNNNVEKIVAITLKENVMVFYRCLAKGENYETDTGFGGLALLNVEPANLAISEETQQDLDEGLCRLYDLGLGPMVPIQTECLSSV